MKSKKFLVLTSVVLFIIALMIAMPKNVFAQETMSAEFKKLLNEDGKLVFNSIKPSKDDFGFYFEILFMYNFDGVMYGNVADDVSSCDFTINYGKSNEETHKVEIVYNYDENVQKTINDVLSKIPKDKKYFEVKDMELVSFWANNAGNDDDLALSNYSGELKEYFENSNIDLYVDVRAGGGSPYSTARIGVAVFKNNGIIYGINPALGTVAEHIIYVPDDTADTKEAMTEVAQKRIDEYLGEKGKVELEYQATAYEVWLEEKYECFTRDNPGANISFEEFKSNGNLYIPTYEKFEDVFGIKGIEEEDLCFLVNVHIDENKGECFNVIVLKDSSKMVEPSNKTIADMSTKVEVTTTSKSVPLDTTIEVEKITSGEVYIKIAELLDEEDYETYDIKLYSASLSEYIEKVDDGEFKVKIPIPERFIGKNLVVYYISDDGKVEEYNVVSTNGFAEFTTNHFSIYTLAEKKSTEEVPDNTPTNTPGEKDETPKTGVVDMIEYVLAVTVISALGIVVLNKKETK